MGGGKFRHRTSNKGAAKFNSGSACESNPTRSKHRSAATAARNASFGGAGMLAVEDRPMNLAADDMLSALPIHSMDIGSSKSMVSEGGISKLSGFTACTNPAFDSVNRVWKSGSSIQAEVVSVLAAIAEVIKERDGKETDVEYCAALMTALEGSSLGNPRRTAAIAYLLHLIVRKVPKEVLQAQFHRFVQILYTKLLENVDSTEGSALKNLISVLGIILRAQQASVWASANTRNMLVSVAALAAHDKPWVRTMARRVIRAVLTDPVTATDNGLHPASGAVGQLILNHIENFLGRSNGDNTNVVRYLCLLEGVMHKMPANLFKKMAESMLKCFAISDSMVKCSSLQCLHRALQRQPCDSALPTETNALLLTALRQLGSSVTDVTVTAYWMQALAEAHVCLTAKDSKKSVQQAFQTLPLFVKIFESGNEQLAQVTYQSLTRVIENSIQDDSDCGKFLLAQLHAAMTMKSASVWKFILRAQMKLYETCGDGLQGSELTKVLEDLARLRQSDDCFCKTELDFTIGAAVRHIGVEHVMKVLSLDVDPDAAILSTDFTRSWLLPVLRVNIHNAPISLFISHFLPIAMKIHRRLPTLQAQVQRLYSTFQFQLWELLPSFCESPADLETSFPDIAPILGAALNERKDLRMTVLNAIRRALRFSLEPDAPPERMEVISRYAKNFMPIFFNMYTGSITDGGYDDKGVRLSVLEAIRLYTEVTPADLVTRYVDSAIAKSKESEESSSATTASQKQARVLDILCALAKVAENDNVSKILDTILPWFNSIDVNGVQKKAYRILEEVIQRRSNPEIEHLLETRNDYVENALFKPIASISFPARASYCSCVHMLFDGCRSMKEVTDLTEKLIVNIIMLLDKDNNVHTRTNSSKCIQFVCSKILDMVEDPTIDTPSAALEPVLSKLYELTTLTSSQKTTGDIALNVARSCLVAANIIAQKQIKILNTIATSKMISFACSWIGEGRAAVRILAIRLLRVLCQKIPEVMLQQFREQILNTVFEGQLTSDLTIKVRKANRLLLEVLVEKFGVDVLQKYTDKPDWLKQMKNIEKLRKRKIRKAASGEGMEQDGDDDDGVSAISGSNVSGKTAGADTILELLEDSDADNESDSEEQLMKKSRVGSVWLKNEGDGDVPMDLLDSSRMMDQITTMNPALLEKRKKKALEKRQKVEAGFQFSKDGKMIVLGDDEEDEDKKQIGKRKMRSGFDGLGDDEDEGARGNKRVKENESDSEDGIMSDDDEDDARDAKTYISKAPSYGGKGIYRDTSGKSQVGSSIGVKKHQRQKSDQQKQKPKQKGVQPYAYVPLRNKTAKQDVRQILKAKRKSGKGKKVTF
ncbi:hypothetical protein GCK72_005850 [Caenorhabditis remanei]|uniref:Uncharacterized protein n=1 Tax=Caenorhabditis remanei TaxID=31234 RepID=A0A6A5HGE4_CAERE|nr:hypothetical protein GCK72_005850 [Caenorhabditis remanei]KAF1765897.1 hypothetical protein GCK72_005850 [Caenorhabditis remanei]